MIGEMLGESRRLHPSAERYQRAAYQRQAAQRLVSMLQDFGGAMLCDGVGLGKTYVATTMMVHYVNAWRDQWAAMPDRLVEDPFRITVIAPHSVVSTWRREALQACRRSAFRSRACAFSRIPSSLASCGRANCSSWFAAAPATWSTCCCPTSWSWTKPTTRSLAARRQKVLRDLLRVQPRRELRRRVVLLTATPINNSLDDLRQEVSLLFSKPIWLSDAKTDDGYRRQALKEVQERCAKARAARTKEATWRPSLFTAARCEVRGQHRVP
jgi:hypothetical protein